MKVYLFNAENGLYQGETFAEADKIKLEDGITSIPVPEYNHGEIPIFDLRENAWAVKPIHLVRQQLNIGQPDPKESHIKYV
jgi:hypothetical protein